MQFIKDVVKEKGNPDENYDINVGIENIIKYMKHIMWDSQEQKAKKSSLGELDENTAFCLKDFCQKVIPTKFREGQKDYFDNKGMILYVDVFFIKDGPKLKKKHVTLLH